MTTTDTIKGKINEAEDMARKIWLAGLGAYGKSVEEAQGRYEKLSEEANKMFDELVTIPAIPEKGDFDVTRLRESKYFFSWRRRENQSEIDH